MGVMADMGYLSVMGVMAYVGDLTDRVLMDQIRQNFEKSTCKAWKMRKPGTLDLKKFLPLKLWVVMQAGTTCGASSQQIRPRIISS